MLRESRFLCVLPGSWHQQMHLFRKQNRDTCFTALGFIRRRENTATWTTPDSCLRAQGPPFRESERVCAADRMQPLPRPDWREESIKLSLGRLYVPRSASRSNVDQKILLQGNRRLLLVCREHIPPSSHTVKIYRNIVATVLLKVQVALKHGKGQTAPLHLG